MAVQEKGMAIDIREESIRVEICIDEACGTCSGCGTKKPRVITVQKRPDIRIGDRVIVETQASDIIKAGILLFLVPTLGFFSGIGVVYYFFRNSVEYMYFMGGIAGTAVSFILLKMSSKRFLHMPEIIRKL